MSMHQMLMAMGSPPNVLTFQTSTIDNTSQTTYSFAGLSIGTASADRYVVVALSSYNGGVSRSVSSCTIGGITATKLVDPGASTDGLTSIWIAAVPTGTTATVSPTYSGAATRAGVGVWTVTGLSSPTAQAGSASTSLNTTNPESISSLSIPAGGCAIASAAMINTGAAGTYTWAGLTKQYDVVIGGAATHSGASLSSSGGTSGLTVSATYTQTPNALGNMCVLILR